jgi:hypothetical protein
MKPTLRIEFTDGTVRNVQTAALDIITWERKFELGLDKLETYEHLCYLAWRSCIRLAFTTADFDTWLADVAAVEFDTDPKDSSDSEKTLNTGSSQI